MSKFLKALQRAEEERLLHEQPWRAESVAQPGVVTPLVKEVPPAPKETTRPAFPPVTSVNTAELTEGIDAHCVSLLHPSTFEAEQYRTLRYMVEQARNAEGNLQVVAVSSPSEGDGKTITAINLAGALAQSASVHVLLIDADLRRPSVAQALGRQEDETPGLVDAILDPRLSLQDVVRPCPPFNLSVLSTGRATAASYEVLKSPRMGELLEEARRRYDYIVLDTPPLLPFPDCRLLGKWVDGFFVLVRAHKTTRKLVEEALTIVDQEQLLGLVFNRDERCRARYGAKKAHSSSAHAASQETQNGEPREGRFRGSLFQKAARRTPATQWE